MKKLLLFAICIMSFQLVSAQSMKSTSIEDVSIDIPSDWTSQAGDFVGYLYLSPKQDKSNYRDHAVVLIDDAKQNMGYKELEKKMMNVIEDYISQSSILSHKTQTVIFKNNELSTTMNVVAEAGNAVLRSTSKVVDNQIVTVLYFVDEAHKDMWESQIKASFASF